MSGNGRPSTCVVSFRICEMFDRSGAERRTPPWRAPPLRGRSPPRIGCKACRRGGRDRKSVVEGKSVSVRVDLGGRRIIKKKRKVDVNASGMILYNKTEI